MLSDEGGTYDGGFFFAPGDDLVDVAVSLQQAHNGAQNATGGDGQQHAGQPAPVPLERRG